MGDNRKLYRRITLIKDLNVMIEKLRNNQITETNATEGIAIAVANVKGTV